MIPLLESTPWPQRHWQTFELRMKIVFIWEGMIAKKGPDPRKLGLVSRTTMWTDVTKAQELGSHESPPPRRLKIATLLNHTDVTLETNSTRWTRSDTTQESRQTQVRFCDADLIMVVKPDPWLCSPSCCPMRVSSAVNWQASLCLSRLQSVLEAMASVCSKHFVESILAFGPTHPLHLLNSIANSISLADSL
jgi:hypothetical protein